MLFELVLFAGGCHNGACRLERPIVERRPVRSVLTRIDRDRETKTEVTRERKVRRVVRVR